MTEDQFFATIKLVSGDEIICLAEPYDNGVITYKPLIIEDLSVLEEIMDDIQVKGLKLSKWIKSSTDDTFFIEMSKIITINELLEPGLTHYKRAVTDLEDHERERSQTNKKQKYRGHRSSIKDARSKFNELFDNY